MDLFLFTFLVGPAADIRGDCWGLFLPGVEDRPRHETHSSVDLSAALWMPLPDLLPRVGACWRLWLPAQL